jgi:hypothetical protein
MLYAPLLMRATLAYFSSVRLARDVPAADVRANSFQPSAESVEER